MGKQSAKKVNWKLIHDDIDRLIRHLHQELGWFDKESLSNTPRRITNFYKEFYGTSSGKLQIKRFGVPASQARRLIILRKIKTYSMCQHHMLPFENEISIGYLPSDEGGLCGLSKLARVAQKFSKKPSTQEQLTQEIVDFLKRELRPTFVMCKIDGKHDCSMIRGVKQPSTLFTTVAVRWNEETMGSGEPEKLEKDFIAMIDGKKANASAKIADSGNP